MENLSRSILLFFPWKISGFCLSKNKKKKKNDYEWKITIFPQMMENLAESMLPFPRSWKLFPCGKSAASGLRRRRKRRRAAAPYPASGAKRVRGWFCWGWRGDGGGAVADTETSHFSWVWFASRDWPTAGSSLSFPPPPSPSIRVRLFPLLSVLASRFFSHRAHLPPRRRVWRRSTTVLAFTFFTGSSTNVIQDPSSLLRVARRRRRRRREWNGNVRGRDTFVSDRFSP